MQFSFVSLCLVLALFSLTVVVGFVLTRQTADKSSARILAAFLIANMASLMNFLYVSTGLILSVPGFGFLGNTIGLSAAPLLFFYSCALAHKDFQVKPAYLMHFLPVLFFLGIVIVAYSIKPTAIQLDILTKPAFPSAINSVLLPLGIFGFVFFYLLRTIHLLMRHRRHFKDFYAARDLSDLAWLRISVIGAAVVWTSSLAHTIAVQLWPFIWVDKLFITFIAGSAFALGLYFLIQALRQSAMPAQGVPNLQAPAEKYGHLRIDDQALQDFSTALEAHFAAEKPFLDPDLSLDDLARALPMTGRELSQTINRHYGQSFFDLINAKRIDHAKHRLLHEPNVTVTEIMLASGYRSKSSFYAAFKKATGQTPTAFRSTAENTASQ